jgi:nitrite reductase (NADH) large subunit
MKVLIIGNGIAGVSVAGALRKLEADPALLSIDIFTREPYELYSRIRLPEVFRSRLESADLAIYRPEWYEERSIRVHKNREVVRLERLEKRVVLSDGERIGYDKLVLCMGADSSRPPIPNSDLQGIFTIREYGDADGLRRYLQAGTRQAAVVGGGLLGLEAAHHLLSPGLERLTIIEQEKRLLPRQLDETGAALLKRLVERWPCQVLVGNTVSGFVGRGRVEAVRLAGGAELPAQTVLISAGIKPRLGLARDAGLEVNRGIVVDARLRSSDPDIFVAGDLAEFEGVVWGIIPAALDHAPVVAHNLLGAGGERLYRQTIPQNTLKVAGIELTSLGKVNLEDERGYEVVRRYDEELARYEKWVFGGGRLVGCLLLGSREHLALARRSLGRELDPAAVRSFAWHGPTNSAQKPQPGTWG